MKTSELLKLLKKHGITFVRNGGNHDIYYSPITHKKLKIGRHGSKEVATGAVSNPTRCWAKISPHLSCH